jgi:hypothetical protein
MCTVTLIPTDVRGPGSRGWRLACNRDERRTRRAGLPPEFRICGERQAVMPIDPESDGTWVAVNDAGLVAALLNANTKRPMRGGAWREAHHDSRIGLLVSRGTVIPKLMACGDVAEAAAELRSVNSRLFPPFRLMAFDGHTVLTASFDGPAMACTTAPLGDEPIMLTSSGLGDETVEPPRRGQFRTMFAAAPSRWREVQDAFHRHRFPGQPHLSVNMSRADARTVSLTVIERSGDRVALTYHSDAPDHPTAPVARAELALQWPAGMRR